MQTNNLTKILNLRVLTDLLRSSLSYIQELASKRKTSELVSPNDSIPAMASDFAESPSVRIIVHSWEFLVPA